MPIKTVTISVDIQVPEGAGYQQREGVLSLTPEQSRTVRGLQDAHHARGAHIPDPWHPINLLLDAIHAAAHVEETRKKK